MRGQIGALVLFLVAVVLEGRAIDDEIYRNFWDLPPSLFYDNLKKFSTDDEPYYADDIPMVLRENPSWPTPSTKPIIGQVGGLAVDSTGNVVVLHRADRRWEPTSFTNDVFNPSVGPIKDDVILTLSSKTGDRVSSAGSGEYYMPHGLTIDADDNLWLTDVGRHQVLKIPKGSTTPSLVLGVKMEPGNDDTHFCKPTDVAVASNGEFFVADGYCNNRILKFAPNGTLLHKWGKQLSDYRAPREDEFYIPHSLALDESRDLLCVADRENNRIQCFSAGLNGSSAGTFRDSFQPGEGPIYAIEYDQNADVLYAVNGPGFGNAVEGFTLDMEGNLLETWNPEDQTFDQPHDVTVSRDGASVYVGDIGKTTGVYKLERQAETVPVYKK